MAAKASLEQFDVILTAGPKGLDIEDEKLLNTLRSPTRTLELESVGFPFVSHHDFLVPVPWKAEGEILYKGGLLEKLPSYGNLKKQRVQ